MRQGIAVGDIVLTSTKLEKGFWDWYTWDYRNRWEAFEDIEMYNRKLGIHANDFVITLPDESVCISLYLMNQRGWNGYGNLFRERDEIKNKIDLGAKYLFISDSTLIANPFIGPYTTHKIGQYKNISVFDLRLFAK